MISARNLRHVRTAAFALIVLTTAAMPVRAGCVWSDIVRDEARASTVQASAPRTYFVEDGVTKTGCPNQSPACRARAYLTDGDSVLIGRSEGGFTCAGFTGRTGVATIGWLPTVALARPPESASVPTDFVGHWVGPEQNLIVEAGAGDSLAVKGEATWGLGDASRRARGAVHTGEIVGTARPEKGILAFTMGVDGGTLPYAAGEPEDCRVRMWRRGPYLLVRDNNACGGANVSFSGFYARQD